MSLIVSLFSARTDLLCTLVLAQDIELQRKTRCTASPSHLKTEKLANNLRLCGENWLTNLKFSSLKEMTQVPSLSLRLTPVDKFVASRIEETVWENQCSDLLHLGAHSSLHLLHLTCVFQVFLAKCCNRSSLKPAWPMCDGRTFASPLFRRLAGRGAFFVVSRFDGFYAWWPF